MTPRVQTQNQSIRRVTYVGMAVNVTLAVVKIVFGGLVGSIALVADGFHSLSDLATDAAVLAGIYFGSKEPDPEHPYGHGRIETFSAAFVAMILILLGCFMIYKAGMDIAKAYGGNAHIRLFEGVVVAVSVISVVAKELLYRWTRRIARTTHSAALYANAWHHRSDALSSVAVLIGAVAVLFGYPYGDRIAAIVVGLMIVLVGVRVIDGCIREFSERAVDARTVEQIHKIIESEKHIRSWHKLRTRSLGREIFLDVHILVNPQLNITEAHEIAEGLEQTLHEQMPQPVNVMVHIEPDLPALRK